MIYEKLLAGLRDRRAKPETRIDMKTVPSPPLYDVATEMAVRAAERDLEVELPALLSRIYREVGNGGFGPGAGQIGLANGYLDADGRTLPEKYRQLRSEGWRERLLPLWDWGDAAWSCVDASSVNADIVTVGELGFVRTEFSLETWLSAWLHGIDLHGEIFEIGDATIVNPFTRKPMTVKRRVRAMGTPI